MLGCIAKAQLCSQTAFDFAFSYYRLACHHAMQMDAATNPSCQLISSQTVLTFPRDDTMLSSV